MPAYPILYPGAPAANLSLLVQAYKGMIQAGDLPQDVMLRITVHSPRPDQPLFVWLLVDKPNRPVGEVSLFNLEGVKGEVGIVMTPKCPKYLGTKTFIDVCHRAYSEMKLERLEAYIRISNAPAVAAAKRFGFTQEGMLRRAAPTVHGKMEHVLVFGLLKDEFYAKWGDRNGSRTSVHRGSLNPVRAL